MRAKLFTLLFASVVSAGILLAPRSTSAVTAADWQSGRIIDDIVFTDKNAMSVADIQNFLNQKVGTTQANGTPGVCDTNGSKTSELGGGTRAQYGSAHGNPAPFTCLKDYYEVPKTTPGPGIPASNYGGQPIPSGAISAAQIIWNAAQQNGINPKVLITLIQKESAGPLITDDWPFKSQYNYALGSHCPDSTGCDPNYAGFSIQVYSAAGLLRYYLDNMAQPWWPYKKIGSNAVLYSPNSGCGSSVVNISTYATAGLYTYTPYQPNQAALNNMYGSGDACSSYGNRNFWRMYSDWFGSTYAPSYSWQLTSQYAFTDSTKTTGIGLNNMLPGQRAYIGFTVVNTGNTVWTNSGPNAVNVGTLRPIARTSAFYDPTWLGYSRPATMKEASVGPGQTATFEFWIQAPQSSVGNFNEYFGLVSEGKAWMPDIGMYYGISVQPARFTWQLTSQYAFTDDSKTTATGLGGMEPGQRKFVGFTAKNTGNVTWSNSGPNPVDVGTQRPTDRASQFYDPTWLGYGRPARMKEATVAPGQTATFEFWIKAPVQASGNFNEYFNLVAEGTAWMQDIGFNYASSVITPNYSWQLTSQYAFSDATKTTAIGLGNLSPGQTAYIGFTAKNVGNITWRNDGANPLDVGTTNPSDRSSPFCAAGLGWLGCNRPARMKEATVAPGQTATFEFAIKAPATPGTYREYFSPVAEGITWLPYIGFNYQIVVR